jgi:cytochrome bd-type quinol oxidase subunit 2
MGNHNSTGQPGTPFTRGNITNTPAGTGIQSTQHPTVIPGAQHLQQTTSSNTWLWVIIIVVIIILLILLFQHSRHSNQGWF